MVSRILANHEFQSKINSRRAAERQARNFGNEELSLNATKTGEAHVASDRLDESLLTNIFYFLIRFAALAWYDIEGMYSKERRPNFPRRRLRTVVDVFRSR